MTRVYIGTKNADKVAALRSALSEIPGTSEFDVIKIELELLERPPFRQPVGWSQIYTGAERRAVATSVEHGAGYHIGVQSGLIEYSTGTRSVWMDQACVFVLFTAGGVTITAFAATATVPIPDEFVTGVKGGLNELGALIKRYGGSEDKDAVAFFSRRYARRRDFVADALKSAFGSISFQEELERHPVGTMLSLVKK